MADSALAPALTTNEQITLAYGRGQVYGFLSVTPPTVLATALVNQTMASSQYPLKEITVDNASANWTSSNDNATIDITDAGGTVLRGTYRFRKPPTATKAFLGEIGNGDWGLLTELNRQNIGGGTVIQDNDKISVYTNRFDIWSAAPEIIYPAGSFYEDAFDYAGWTTAFGTIASGYPIANIGPHRSQFVDFGQSYATMAFTANALAWSPIGPTPTYSWTIPGTWTVTSGSSSTQSFTARVPGGFHILKCVISMVSPEGSAGTVAQRAVWVHGSGSPQLYIPLGEVTSDVRDRTGRNMTIKLPGTLIEGSPFLRQSLTYGAMVDYFEVVTWPFLDVPTVTKNFTGWVTARRWDTEPVSKQNWEIDISGPAGIMERLGSYSQWIERNATPTSFQQVKPANCTLNYAIWYMLRLRVPNLLKLFDHHPFSIDQTVGALKSITVEASSSLLGQMQDLAKDLGCNYGHSSTGAGWVRMMPSFVPAASRSTYLIIRDILTKAKYSTAKITRNEKPRVRRLRVNQIFYNTVSTEDEALAYDAPGDAPGQGVADEELDLVGLQPFGNVGGGPYSGAVYAYRNNPLPEMNFQVPGNRDVIEPAEGPRIDVSAAFPTLGADQATRYATPLSISKRLINGGGAIMDWTLEGETTGVDGVEVA